MADGSTAFTYTKANEALVKGGIGVAVKISKPLKRLLKASVLGRNKNHPLAGWNV